MNHTCYPASAKEQAAPYIPVRIYGFNLFQFIIYLLKVLYNFRGNLRIVIGQNVLIVFP